MPFISREEIDQAIERLAREIQESYRNSESLLLLPILNGAFVFCADLARKINLEHEIQFVKVSSYEGTTSSGKIRETIGIAEGEIEGKSVLVVEDIVDTGHTINFLREHLALKGAKEVKTVSLLFKPDAFEYEKSPEFIGISCDNLFVVGYGMDYDKLGRNLPDIYVEAP